jgi:hypothetical protein
VRGEQPNTKDEEMGEGTTTTGREVKKLKNDKKV